MRLETSCFLSLMLVGIMPLSGQVQGVTSTQAVLSYTAPSAAACTVEVSESASYSPLVHDVDPGIFAASNLDSRASGASSGVYRRFVVGTRKAQQADTGSYAGRWFSRALKANTLHYYRITCGATVITGTFTTANLQTGQSWADPLPLDPRSTSQSFFVSSGMYGYGQYVTNTQTETVTDITGLSIARVTMPGDAPSGNSPTGNHSYDLAVGPAWTNPSNAIGNVSPATISGSTGILYVGATPNIYGLSDYTHYIGTASCSSPCSIEIAATLDRGTPWANYWVTQALTSTPAAVSVTASQLIPAGGPNFGEVDAASRSGTANVDGSGIVTWVNGNLFHPAWSTSSHITISGQDCTVASVSNPKKIAITPSSCPSLSLPASGASWTATNFGILIRKKTTGGETVSIQNAYYHQQAYLSPDLNASGNPDSCNPNLSVNSVTGESGYVCVTASNTLYWIEPSGQTHPLTANYLGLNYVGQNTSTDGWEGQFCANN